MQCSTCGYGDMKALKVTHEGKQYFIDVEQERPLETLLRKFCITVDEIFEECVDDLEVLKKEYGLLCGQCFIINTLPNYGIGSMANMAAQHASCSESRGSGIRHTITQASVKHLLNRAMEGLSVRECLFFGCWGDAGHYLWRGQKQKVFSPSLPFDWRDLDCNFIADDCKWKQGNATLTHISGLTILSFPDNSVDGRPASHSTFVLPGELNFEDSVSLAKLAFPEVWDRYEFEVIIKGETKNV